MAKTFPYLRGALAFFLPILLIISDGISQPVNGQASGQGSWCVPRPSATERTLMDNINFACSVVNCSMIDEGGPCFHPTTLMNHASVAMNLYYQELGRHYWNCDFKESAIIVVTDPSYGDCKFEYAY